MSDKSKALKMQADKARVLYKQGHLTYAEARCEIMPYINACNEKSIEIAKKYGMAPKKVYFSSFIR